MTGPTSGDRPSLLAKGPGSEAIEKENRSNPHKPHSFRLSPPKPPDPVRMGKNAPDGRFWGPGRRPATRHSCCGYAARHRVLSPRYARAAAMIRAGPRMPSRKTRARESDVSVASGLMGLA